MTSSCCETARSPKPAAVIVRRLLIDVGNHHCGAFTGEATGDRFADAASRPRDDGCLSLKPHGASTPCQSSYLPSAATIAAAQTGA